MSIRRSVNPEHLEIAGHGREATDAWRRDNVGGQLDLTRANLSATVLIFTGFSGNDLKGCQFKDSRFS